MEPAIHREQWDKNFLLEKVEEGVIWTYLFKKADNEKRTAFLFLASFSTIFLMTFSFQSTDSA